MNMLQTLWGPSYVATPTHHSLRYYDTDRKMFKPKSRTSLIRCSYGDSEPFGNSPDDREKPVVVVNKVTHDVHIITKIFVTTAYIDGISISCGGGLFNTYFNIYDDAGVAAYLADLMAGSRS